MFRKITSLLLAASFILLVQVADCLAMSADQQTMHCCRTMTCNPSNHSHDCCKKMVTGQTPGALPGLRLPLDPPPAVQAVTISIAPITRTAEIFYPRVEPPQHSPPLYTLYASLLI